MSALFTRFILFALAIFVGQSAFGFDPMQSFEPKAKQAPTFLKVDEAFRYSATPEKDGLKITWDIEDGYYLYQGRIKASSSEQEIAIGELQFDRDGKVKEDPYFGTVSVLYHDAGVFVPLSQTGSLDAAEITISYQGCADAGLCYPPKKQREMFLFPANNDLVAPSSSQANTDVTGGGTASNNTQSNLESAGGIFSFLQEASIASIFGIFLLLGIGLTFTPCVFPMIPIISSIIAGQTNPTPFKSFCLAMAYVLGMAITYSLAGVATGLLGAGANLQSVMQSPAVLIVFAGIFVALALAMFGLYELQLPAVIRDKLTAKSESVNGGQLGGVFVIGAFSALLVSPCVSAPLAGALLYISSTENALIGGTSLFALGLGMGVPLILVAMGGGKFFPKAGAWMEGIKALFGVMLIGVAIILLERVLPGGIILGLWAILLLVSATHLGAFDATSSGWPRTFKGIGICLVVYAAMLSVGSVTGGSSVLKPLDGISISSNTGGTSSLAKNTAAFAKINSLSDLKLALDQAKALDKPVFLDFYADWCISCKVMESKVFPEASVAELMSEFYLVKADVTQNTSDHQDLMDHFNIFGPPSILFFTPKGGELGALHVRSEIGVQGLKKRLQQVLSNLDEQSI